MNKITKILAVIFVPSVIVVGYVVYKKFIKKEPLFASDNSKNSLGGLNTKDPGATTNSNSVIPSATNSTIMSIIKNDNIGDAPVQTYVPVSVPIISSASSSVASPKTESALSSAKICSKPDYTQGAVYVRVKKTIVGADRYDQYNKIIDGCTNAFKGYKKYGSTDFTNAEVRDKVVLGSIPSPLI